MMPANILNDSIAIVHNLCYDDDGVTDMNGFERRKAAKMDKIESAALKLFRKAGVPATSIEQIAAEAGVSKVSIYNYYGDKLALARKIVFDSMDRQAEASNRIMQSPLSFRAKYEQLYAAKMEVMQDLTSCVTTGLLDDELLKTPEVQTFIAEYHEAKAIPILRSLIEQGKREGEIHPDIPTETILLYIHSLQKLLASPLTMRQRYDLGLLFEYGFKGRA